MKKIKIFASVFIALFLAVPGFSQESYVIEKPGRFSFLVKTGYSIGATSPLGIPASIRSIDSYKLTPSFSFGGDVRISLYKKWGIMTGLRLENKAMNADVTTKSYHMEIEKGDSKIEGLFTGHVSQKVTEWMFTLPLEATYSFNRKLLLRTGPYFSFLFYKNFSGIASDGYIRNGSPVGPKILIGNKEGEWATYDFSDEMQLFQTGLGLGIDGLISSHFGISGDLNWGLSGIFKTGFDVVEKPLFPIYGTLSVFYKF